MLSFRWRLVNRGVYLFPIPGPPEFSPQEPLRSPCSRPGVSKLGHKGQIRPAACSETVLSFTGTWPHPHLGTLWRCPCPATAHMGSCDRYCLPDSLQKEFADPCVRQTQRAGDSLNLWDHLGLSPDTLGVADPKQTLKARPGEYLLPHPSSGPPEVSEPRDKTFASGPERE